MADAGATSSFDAQAAGLENQLVVYQAQQADYAAKLQALQLYVAKYGARIDVNHRSRDTPSVEQPNLGTSVPSWYYLDGRGNKIFVQDMTFANALSLSRAGRGMTERQAHAHEAQEVVVVVPRAKRNPSWNAEYMRRCEEYDAARRRLGPLAGRVAIPEGRRLIGDGLPPAAGGGAAFDASGRRGGAALWNARQTQAKLLASGSARRSGQQAIADRPSSAAATGVLAAVMVDGSRELVATAPAGADPAASVFVDPVPAACYDAGSAPWAGDSAAALQAEAATLLAQLGAVGARG
jgi:hypothetical protein